MKTVYPLSEASQHWLTALIGQAERGAYGVCFAPSSKTNILVETFQTYMPDHTEARIVASVQTTIGDWAAYIGAGPAYYVHDWGSKLPESVARACFPNFPADLFYRP